MIPTPPPPTSPPPPPPAGGPAASMTVRGFASAMTARRYSLTLASTSVDWTAAGAAVWHLAVGSCWSTAAGYAGAGLLTALRTSNAIRAGGRVARIVWCRLDILRVLVLVAEICDTETAVTASEREIPCCECRN